MHSSPNAERISGLALADKSMAVSKLACGLAHDLNNYLTVIMGRAQMGQAASGQDPRLNALFNQISEASERAAAQVRQIMILARQDELRHVRFDANALAGTVADNARAILGARVEFRPQVPRRTAFMTGDPVQVEQILVDLLRYARESLADNGAVEFDAHAVDVDSRTVERFAGVRPGRFLRIAVRLVDPGGSEERAAYEPFVSSRHRGSGITLTIVDYLTRLHHGFLEVTGSSRNRTAAVHLPLNAAPAGNEADANAEREV